MATSPIYNWPEPDNTDLVKNGALAIRTLGNAIDTTMATMVPKTIVDAKGDLIAGTAADTAARLAVGNNGETLVADSSTSTGLRYTAGTVSDNPVLNSAFQVWQRGTSISYNNEAKYSADRWYGSIGNTAATISRQATNDTTNLPFVQYCMRLARNSGSTNTGSITMQQNFETINSIPYAGKTVTLSFYARAGANFSAASNLIAVYLITGTGTDQVQAIGYTGQAVPVNSAATLTTTWQRFTYTATIAATATEMSPTFAFVPTGTAGANDWYEITGVQIDVGSVALPFRTNAGTIQGELAACQRYFYRANATSYSNTSFAMGYAYATNGASYLFNLPVTQRSASPTLTVSAGGDFQVGGTSGGVGVTSVNFGNANTTLVRLDVVPVSAGLTVNQSTELRAVNTNAWIGISAEL